MLLGALATAALAPVFILPLLIPAFSGLFLLVSNASTRRQAFWDGWWWGLGHFATGLYWICISLYVQPEKFAWLTPFALFGLPSVLAVYTGLVTLAFSLLIRGKRRETAEHISPRLLAFSPFVFASLWIIAEYARAHLFTGFPWNLTGYAWNISDITLQMASVWGIYGQSWLAVLLATLPALFIAARESAARYSIAGILIAVAFAEFGIMRLDSNPTEYTFTKLRIVQANIPQSLKFSEETAMEGLRKHILLMHSEGIDQANIVIWPETAVPLYMQAGSGLARDIGSMLAGNTQLVTGGMRAEGTVKNWKAWNSAFVIRPDGSIAAQYDKHHLVPFGEYIPLRNVAPFIVENIAGGMGDFQTGPGPSTLALEGLPAFSPLICYEAIFPGYATDGTRKAQWLVNITNDAWFGASSGPYQHLEMARTRAVEQGLPLARAANTGISAIYDAYGRQLHRLGLLQEGIIDASLPKIAPETIYSRYGDFFILLIALSSIFFAFFFRRKG